MKEKSIRGGNYITKVLQLLYNGVEVDEKNINIAGIRCKQITIGGKYRTISRTQTMIVCSMFEYDGNSWSKLPVPWAVSYFIMNLVRYRKYVLIKNKAQEDTTNN